MTFDLRRWTPQMHNLRRSGELLDKKNLLELDDLADLLYGGYSTGLLSSDIQEVWREIAERRR